MDKETADKMRGMVRRVVLKNIKDNGQTQTASVEVADGIWREDVEIMQPFGVASHPPEDGAVTLAFAIGGDEGDMVVLPPSNPSARMGGLKAGEIGLCNNAGDKLVIDAGGNITAVSGTSLTLRVGGVTLTVSAAGIDITGGKITHNGKDIGDTHVHSGILPGGSNTGTPA
ncbi:phage baseplate assembly protein [Rhizobium sp. CFBP 8762]|uniref:phage baseplate assembly protein domain-containing protein n=1 Tax=Rhizobium sp. CFBP 8762 TaxID=2775279 RepID=UPI00177C6CBD|nr:phage baseplate assembly protein [Rhizobium sp. CFBP 8762]MBD8554924.1 phage baseplate assembly protein [Rhizobium sp. CFBP 8762]